MIDLGRIRIILIVQNLHFVSDRKKRQIRSHTGSKFLPLSKTVGIFDYGTMFSQVLDEFDNRSFCFFDSLNEVADILPPHNSDERENNSQQSEATGDNRKQVFCFHCCKNQENEKATVMSIVVFLIRCQFLVLRRSTG